MRTRTSVGFALLKIASLYMMAALLLGLFMGMTKSFSLISVHSHIGLLGWLTMAVTGLVYFGGAQLRRQSTFEGSLLAAQSGPACHGGELGLDQYGGGTVAEAFVG